MRGLVQRKRPAAGSCSVRALLAGIALAAAAPAFAASTTIADSPLAQETGQVRANLMFLMDDSGSMNDEFLPNGVNNNSTRRCFGYSGYNRIFFDPAVEYTPPVDSAGVSFDNQSFTSARGNGFAAGSAVVDLSNMANLTTPTVVTSRVLVSTAVDAAKCTRDVTAGCSDSTTINGTTETVVALSSCKQNGTDCTKTTTTNTVTTGKFYWATLNTGATSNCSDANYTLVTSAAALSDAQKQNYANWYSYYRKRAYTMRTAAGKVFANIDATKFRVGYTTIQETGTTDNTRFLNIRDYDAGTQKVDFFSKLYASPTNGGTSLRPALEKVGKYFAGRNLDGTSLASGRDPVQYHCQRNYALLSADGSWNNVQGAETAFRANYAPTRLDGSTTIGNQDNAAGTLRPYLDDGKTQGNNNWVTGGTGVANTLADISAYFYQTPLRTSELGNCSGAVSGEDVCTDGVNRTVKPAGADTASHQHMTTFTIGLGVGGQIRYEPNYDAVTSGTDNFFAIKNGSRPWPDPNVGNLGVDDARRIDDFWHAAVNGRGRYYSASDTNQLVASLTDALEQIEAKVGAGSAAATSSITPTAGDNALYLGQYTTALWEGNVKALSIDPVSGAVSSTAAWEARTTLNAQVSATTDTRTVYFRKADVSGTQLASFTFSDLDAAGYGDHFEDWCDDAKLSQCAQLSDSAQDLVDVGDNAVRYLRGQHGYESRDTVAADSRLFRSRGTPLGDLINASPVYVKKAPFVYSDAGYPEFASGRASRTAVVYAAANDGMLHAFNATTGAEMWAYVPSMVMPQMYRLADTSYDHRYFVDGTPVVADVKSGSTWRTILVGGLNKGGRGYYALDITDPASPKSLWEFTDNDLGYSYGNPVITKNKAGTWVVAFTSGYNNVSPGTGEGYLYVLNAVTGQQISKIGTGVGDTTTPSNLGKIAGWINSPADNTSLRIYGGDMLGNLWRFDFDDNVAPSGAEAFLLGKAEAVNGTPQPITTKPQLNAVNNDASASVVAFGTGRYLGSPDSSDTSLQSVYVVKDDLSTTGLGVLRSHAGMVQQSMSAATQGGQSTRRVASVTPVNFSTKKGWFIDFTMSTGERVTVDPLQTNNLLAVATNIPEDTPCTPGGSSYLYFFDISTGGITDAFAGSVMTAGLNLVKIGDTVKVIRWDIESIPDVKSPQTGGGAILGTLRRSSWRELVN